MMRTDDMPTKGSYPHGSVMAPGVEAVVADGGRYTTPYRLDLPTVPCDDPWDVERRS